MLPGCPACRRPRHAPTVREERTAFTRCEAGIGRCNIAKCCTEVCPEHIKITDNGIIPMKERVADRHYDAFARLLRWLAEPMP